MAKLISDNQVFEVLSRQNHWWRSGSIDQDLAPPFKRAAFYETQTWLRQPKLRRAVVLSGARQVGKTVILHQLAQERIAAGTPPRKILYITFEDMTLTQTRLRHILELYEKNVGAIDHETLILLDEIHYAMQWGRELMVVRREFPRTQVVATGSASAVLKNTERQEAATGRWMSVHVPTLSFYEYTKLRAIAGTAIPEIPAEATLDRLAHMTRETQTALRLACEPLQQQFNRYLLQGGFPAAVIQDLSLPMAHRLLRKDVIDTALKRDMAYLHGVRHLSALDQLFVYLCLHTGDIVEKNTIAKEMQAAALTVERHLQHLEDAHLVYRLEPFLLTGKKALKPRPKFYVADSTLRNAVLLRGEGLFKSQNETELGAIVEGTVFKHLYALYYPDAPRLGYWRDPRSGREVDFALLFPDGSRLACEVKYRETATLRPGDGLRELMASSHPLEQALLITKRPNDFGVLDRGRIVQVPAALYTYLVGRAEEQRWLKERPFLPREAPYGQKGEALPEDAMRHLPKTEGDAAPETP